MKEEYNMKNKILLLLLIFSMLSSSVFAKGPAIISVGKDLTLTQRDEILKRFDAGKNDKIIEVSNEEERQYLGEYVDSKTLGTRAISSSYVEVIGLGKGIKVETYNTTWITEDMLINALVTAGVKDALVKVAAPFPVSGTAALTGILKGFEEASGIVITEESKQVANEEIAKTGELGQEIGKDQAASIMQMVKEQVVENNLTSTEEIKEAIENASKSINIELTEAQKAQISELMEKISSLDLNVEDIKSQVKNISDKLKELSKNTEEVKGILAKILDFVKKIFEKINNIFK